MNNFEDDKIDIYIDPDDIIDTISRTILKKT